MGRKKTKTTKKVVTKEDTNVVIKDEATIIKDDTVVDALKKIKNYCAITREQGCEKCMFSTVIFMEAAEAQYPFCDLKGKRPCDYKVD